MKSNCTEPALVTGASSGIGRELARCFGTHGNFTTWPLPRQLELLQLPRHALTAEAVARHGHRAFRRGRVLAIPGAGNRLLTLAVRLLPRAAVRKLVKAGNTLRKADR